MDAEHQIIVAQDVTNCGSDSQQLAPLVKGIKANVGKQAREVSADSGYCSEANLKELNRRGINGYVATGRQKHGEKTAKRQENTGSGNARTRDVGEAETRRPRQSV